jgi:hypothetical protein
LPAHLASQIDLFCAGQKPLQAVGVGIRVGPLDAPNGGAEYLVAIADDHFLVCVAIVSTGTVIHTDELFAILQDSSYRTALNDAYGMLIRLRSVGGSDRGATVERDL